MKKCAYCGHDQDDTAIHCSGCGTVFLGMLATAQPALEPPLRISLRMRLGLLGVAWVLCFFASVIGARANIQKFGDLALATVLFPFAAGWSGVPWADPRFGWPLYV